MRIIKTETKVYAFNELEDTIKELALEKLRDINTYEDWYVDLYDDYKTISALMGIDIDRIYWSGFCSQGDGACFEGYYSYEKGSVKAVKEYAPNDKELHRIVTELAKIQKKCFYSLEAQIKHTGHYYHANSTTIDVKDLNTEYWYSDKHKASEDIKEVLRDFMNWIYGRLESEYEYLISDQAIIETITSNDYEFTAEGNLI